MDASELLRLIIVLPIVALATAVSIRMRVVRCRALTPPGPRVAPVVPSVPVLETADLQLRWHTLSRREEQIARLAAEDCSDEEIARRLTLSVRTVQNHLQHAREKLRIHSRHEFKYFLQSLASELTMAY